ncbi:MAG: peptide chain release factor N(5)-glutamine methyltransferase [Flavobacteriales bacterium]
MSVRVASNTVEAVLEQYQRDLGTLYERGEVRAIAASVFFDRLGWDAGEVMVNRASALSESELLKVILPLKRLRKGEPLQYVLGSTDFHGLRIGVDRHVLIPRPETEELVDLAIRAQEAPPRRILDIGTGSGCIALALKKAFPAAEVTGMDVSAEALRCASGNGKDLGLDVHWLQADILSPEVALPAADLVISNPPYIPQAEEAAMHANVLEHEPHLALFVPDADPLLFYRAIARKALVALPPGGQLWFEGHFLHAPAVAELLRGLGYGSVNVFPDLSGQPRIIRGKWEG